MILNMNIASNVKRIAIVILFIFIVLFALSAPYSTQNIDKLAYVIALGLDVGTTNNLQLTVQLSKPTNSSSNSGSFYKKIIETVECSSIDSGISLLNDYISRRLDLSHCKILVISEELASRGISDYIFKLMSDTKISAHASIIVSKTPAREFLNVAQPELESVPSKFYEIALTSNEYTGYTQNVSLIDFFSDYVDTFTNPVAILGSVGDIPINSADNIELLGIAVFNKDKLVGELSAQESILHLMVSNNLQSCIISIPNPIGDTESIDINLRLRKDTKNSVEIVNGTPHISSKLQVEARIISATQQSTSNKNIASSQGEISSTQQSSVSDNNYYSPENSKLIEETCSKYLQKNIIDYLYKTSKEYKSDIDGFGKYAVKYFPTIQDWQEYNWLENYQNSIFNVEVETKLRSGSTFL